MDMMLLSNMLRLKRRSLKTRKTCCIMSQQSTPVDWEMYFLVFGRSPCSLGYIYIYLFFHSWWMFNYKVWEGTLHQWICVTNDSLDTSLAANLHTSEELSCCGATCFSKAERWPGIRQFEGCNPRMFNKFATSHHARKTCQTLKLFHPSKVKENYHSIKKMRCFKKNIETYIC